MEMNRVFGQSLRPETSGHLASKDSSHNAIGVSNRQCRLDLFTLFQRWRSQIQQHLIIERILQAVILRNLAVASHVSRDFWLVKNRSVFQTLGFPVFDGFTNG